ncbi:hypothetical protein K2Z84_19420 [Candidatus Binatia bacterium]|jgi:hypothetical protein|nr:hypothetical protein [Candidatus Binatia bacterium]
MLRRIAHVSALLAVVTAGGCSASRPASAPPAMPTSKAYHQADADCRHVAARETENVAPQTQASKAAIAIYWRCMTAKGFPPPNASTSAPVPAPAASPSAH